MSSYSANLDALPFPFLALNHSGEVLHANKRWRTEFGVSSALAFDGLTVFDEATVARWKRCLKVAQDTLAPFQFDAQVHLATETRRYWFSVELQDEKGSGWLVLATPTEDICEKIAIDYEQDQVALRLVSQQWHSFFFGSASGKAIVGLSGEIIAVNPQLCFLFGYDEAEILQLSLRELRHPDDREPLDKIYQLLLEGGSPVIGVLGRYQKRSGGNAFLLVSFSLVRDSKGHPLYFAVEMQDDTARRAVEGALEEKVRESTLLNHELTRSNADLERFAFVASHDLQEPLRKIRIFGGRLEKALEPLEVSEQGRDSLQRMLSAASRMQQLISDLLEFSRPSAPHVVAPVDLTKLTHECVADFETSLETLQGQIEIEELPTIYGDASRLRQMLCNLIGNALKFHGEAPPFIRISARPATQEQGSGSLSGERELPKRWEILVRDNGIGFDDSDLPRVLEVFGRLHPRNRFSGTGIGLAICRRVAQEHGGDITAISEPGVGTTFIVSLLEKPSLEATL